MLIFQSKDLIQCLSLFKNIGHWIAARDSRDLTQFVWDDDHSQINISPTLINNGTFNSTTTFLTCGAFQINQVGSSVLMVDCSKNNGYALCELVEP